MGFPNDPMYPAYYSLGPETLKNEGCNTTLSASEEKYQKVSRRNSSRSGNNGIGISRQMVSHCLTFPYLLQERLKKWMADSRECFVNLKLVEISKNVVNIN